MIPIMTRTLKRYETDVSLDTYELQSVNFVQTQVMASSLPIKAVVQPAQREKLEALGVDLTLRYIEVHAEVDIVVGQYIKFKGRDYKVLTPGDYQLYGFSDVICAEVKGAIT
jgi:hypothetical protein